MTHAIYSRQQLEDMNRTQLWVICGQLGVKKFPKSTDCVEAILEKMPQPVEAEEIKPEAEIINDGEYNPWVIVSGGEEIDRFPTYLKALNSGVAKKFNIIEKTVENYPDSPNMALFDAHCAWKTAQTEFEQYIEAQAEDIEAVDDYLFHDDPVPYRGSERDKIPQVGDILVTSGFILKCSQTLTTDYAAVWDIYDGNYPIGEILIDYVGFWSSNQSLSLLTTPYEAIADLIESAYELA